MPVVQSAEVPLAAASSISQAAIDRELDLQVHG
jgi:hypothetical protein